MVSYGFGLDFFISSLSQAIMDAALLPILMVTAHFCRTSSLYFTDITSTPIKQSLSVRLTCIFLEVWIADLFGSDIHGCYHCYTVCYGNKHISARLRVNLWELLRTEESPLIEQNQHGSSTTVAGLLCLWLDTFSCSILWVMAASRKQVH